MSFSHRLFILSESRQRRDESKDFSNLLNEMKTMILAAKCAPDEGVLSDIARAGIGAVELYLSTKFLQDVEQVVRLCKNFDFRYAVHAPPDGFTFEPAAEVAKAIGAEVIVVHNVYWEDEWEGMVQFFKGTSVHLCVENIYSAIEPLKVMRRFGVGMCLDLEHLQQECSGVFEEAFIDAMSAAAHIHLTGFAPGSDLWHTHIHHSPEWNRYILGLLKQAGYTGLVVSEARVKYQTYAEFKALNDFFIEWQKSCEMPMAKGQKR